MTDGAAWSPPDDPITAPFWAAAAEGRLVAQRCAQCGGHQLYPRPFCLACDATDLAWVDVAGRGQVYSMTVNRLQVTRALEPPYAIALVALDEGPRVMAHVTGEGLAIDSRVRVAWQERPGDSPLLVARADGP